jgi:hypothetical protein
LKCEIYWFDAAGWLRYGMERARIFILHKEQDFRFQHALICEREKPTNVHYKICNMWHLSMISSSMCVPFSLQAALGCLLLELSKCKHSQSIKIKLNFHFHSLIWRKFEFLWKLKNSFRRISLGERWNLIFDIHPALGEKKIFFYSFAPFPHNFTAIKKL